MVQAKWAALVGAASAASCVDLQPPWKVSADAAPLVSPDGPVAAPADAPSSPPDASSGLPPDAGRDGSSSSIAGLVGYWRFDEGSGTTAADSAGNHRGTLVNGPSWASEGFPGSMFPNPHSLKFDGVDDVVNAGTGPDLTNLRALTVAAWIKPLGDGEAGLGRIVNKRSPKGWLLDVCGNSCPAHTLAFLYSFSMVEGTWTSPAGAIVPGQWQHVAVTYDASSVANRPAMYIDGAAMTVSVSIAPAGEPTDDGAADLLIGNDSVSARTFDGWIDDVRIYNRVLTPGEIASLGAGE